MYFNKKSYLKSNYYHTAKHTLNLLRVVADLKGSENLKYLGGDTLKEIPQAGMDIGIKK